MEETVDPWLASTELECPSVWGEARTAAATALARQTLEIIIKDSMVGREQIQGSEL